MGAKEYTDLLNAATGTNHSVEEGQRLTQAQILSIADKVQQACESRSHAMGVEEIQDLVEDVQARLLKATGKHVEVMVYGDGAFKDPVGKIWELADPVVSPAYTAGLEGTPNELKLKYLADNDFASLSGEALRDAIKGEIKKKDGSLVGKMAAQGTTPRRLTDLIGSLCDLTSGSGDKGTPIVYIQGYFDNYTTE